MGPTMRQGMHHGAQKSTSTSPFLVSSAKLSSVNSIKLAIEKILLGAAQVPRRLSAGTTSAVAQSTSPAPAAHVIWSTPQRGQRTSAAAEAPRVTRGGSRPSAL